MKKILLVALVLGGFGACSSSERGEPNPALPRQIEVTARGPSAELIEETRQRVGTLAAVQAVLDGTRHRLLSFELRDEPSGDDEGVPNGYRATFFDYTNNRAYVVSGRFEQEDVIVEQSDVQPEPNEEEFNEAVDMLRSDPVLGSQLQAGTIVPYEPMPPLAEGDRPVGDGDRIVNVGFMSDSGASLPYGTAVNEIVGVNMTTPSPRQAEALELRSPPSGPCGPTNARQSTTARGTAGSFNVVIRRGNVELWNFLVVRPSASSGRRGSGLELRNVRYRTKPVFARAHVPILNVQYEANRCGPFRDWQWQEGSFVADGTNVAAGIRQTVTAPTTAVDTNVDQGNFRGVAIFDNGTEVQLVTEMNAGWYRYVMKWFLRDDGVIFPQFGFGAVRNSCVCNRHFHHAYWRFDFDVAQSANNTVCLKASGEDPQAACTPVATETRLATIPGHLDVRNGLGSEGYRLTPGPRDGAPDAFSRATAWILAARNEEIDDGVNCTEGASCRVQVDLDRFVNNEPVNGRNLVVWYRASFTHEQENGGEVGADHIVGPELRPFGW